jgi:transposase-like protein
LQSYRELDRIEIKKEVFTIMARTTYTAKFKSDMVIEVLKGEETLGAIAARHNVHPNMLRNWKKEFLEKAPGVFEDANRKREAAVTEREIETERDELLKTVGQLTIERDWLKKKANELFGPEYEKRFNRK